ncbi:c-type cytochrome [Novispirillum itersonii]|uniref:Cytochrome c n=1 Tax=Novispirillum itersonii TaxID=189 RepID=A0A7W9ZC42_NOVIT|nr:cytochrome c family protein [Novispirillum itersonii]MBB6208762.1 cytochrome c [Novispirillum itersonii]
MQTLFKLAAAVIVAAVLVVVVNVYGAAVYKAAAPADVSPDARPKMVAAPKAAAAQATAELRPGDVELGKKAAKACASCHTFEQGGANKVGPNLFGAAGAKIAHVQGFKYSDTVAAHGGEWTDENLDHWLANPKEFIPGTKMAFAGIKDKQQRLDVIAYLHSLK